MTAARAPDVAVIDVMVVGNGNGGDVLRQVAERPAPEVPLVEIVEPWMFAVGPRGACALVDVVPAEEKEIGFVGRDMFGKVCVGKPEALPVPVEGSVSTPPRRTLWLPVKPATTILRLSTGFFRTTPPRV